MIAVHQRYTVLSSRLSKNATDMVLHRVLREIEPGSNLLIRQPPTNKFNQLLFAPAEIRTMSIAFFERRELRTAFLDAIIQ